MRAVTLIEGGAAACCNRRLKQCWAQPDCAQHCAYCGACLQALWLLISRACERS
jgi:hypothetical protein